MSGFVGRMCVILFFLASFLAKYNHFDMETGGVTTQRVAPKLKEFKTSVESFFHEKMNRKEFRLPAVQDKHYVMMSMGVEAVGSALFLFDVPIGADLLMFDLLVTTPITQDFWNTPVGSQGYHDKLVIFLKDIAIFGSLLTYGSMKMKLKAAKKEAAAVAGDKKTK